MPKVNEVLHVETFAAVERAILEVAAKCPDADIDEAINYLMMNLNFKARACGVDTTRTLKTMLLMALSPEGVQQVAIGRAQVVSALSTRCDNSSGEAVGSPPDLPTANREADAQGMGELDGSLE